MRPWRTRRRESTPCLSADLSERAQDSQLSAQSLRRRAWQNWRLPRKMECYRQLAQGGANYRRHELNGFAEASPRQPPGSATLRRPQSGAGIAERTVLEFSWPALCSYSSILWPSTFDNILPEATDLVSTDLRHEKVRVRLNTGSVFVDKIDCSLGFWLRRRQEMMVAWILYTCMLLTGAGAASPWSKLLPRLRYRKHRHNYLARLLRHASAMRGRHNWTAK